ncbi:hypothetical protein ACROYT_G009332 [Oculina patagonica]
MKSFALFVLLATLTCFLLNTRETEGQLSFNVRRRRKPGRSLDNENTRNVISIDDPLMVQRSDIMIDRPGQRRDQATRRSPKFPRCI